MALFHHIDALGHPIFEGSTAIHTKCFNGIKTFTIAKASSLFFYTSDGTPLLPDCVVVVDHILNQPTKRNPKLPTDALILDLKQQPVFSESFIFAPQPILNRIVDYSTFVPPTDCEYGLNYAVDVPLDLLQKYSQHVLCLDRQIKYNKENYPEYQF